MMRRNLACIINYGCQMNEYESSTVGKMLTGAGYELTRDPDEAEVVILNTCTVRDKADQKVWNRLEHLLPQKRRSKGEKKIGLMGCMVAAQKEALMQKHPEIDFLVTPLELSGIGRILADVTARRFEDYSVYEHQSEGEEVSNNHIYMPIQTGCNFNCTYCIVPSVKGREINTSAEEIISKIHSQVQNGITEVTLLGQTINSWRHEKMRFADLLDLVASRFPDVWIRFLTSHPVLFENRILDIVARYDNLCPWFHIPAQSGSSRVLSAMKRGYDRKRYLELVSAMREVPGACLSTDMICGFPTETEEEFQESLSLLKEVRFETAFLFYYSERRDTKAAAMEGSLPEEVRKERLKRMVDVQREVQTKRYAEFVGQEFFLSAQAISRRDDNMLKGKGQNGMPVLFSGDPSMLGKRFLVKITDSTSQSLLGEIVS